MKVYITKYALTKGILERIVEQFHNNPNNVVDKSEIFHQYFHGEGNEWHKTIESAKIKAESMRVTKIKSLTNQLNKLNDLKF